MGSSYHGGDHISAAPMFSFWEDLKCAWVHGLP